MRANIPPTTWSLAARVAIAAYNTLHREQHVVLIYQIINRRSSPKEAHSAHTTHARRHTHTHMHPRTHTDTPGNQVPGVYASVHMSVFLLSCEFARKRRNWAATLLFLLFLCTFFVCRSTFLHWRIAATKPPFGRALLLFLRWMPSTRTACFHFQMVSSSLFLVLACSLAPNFSLGFVG